MEKKKLVQIYGVLPDEISEKVFDFCCNKGLEEDLVNQRVLIATGSESFNTTGNQIFVSQRSESRIPIEGNIDRGNLHVEFVGRPHDICCFELSYRKKERIAIEQEILFGLYNIFGKPIRVNSILNARDERLISDYKALNSSNISEVKRMLKKIHNYSIDKNFDAIIGTEEVLYRPDIIDAIRYTDRPIYITSVKMGDDPRLESLVNVDAVNILTQETRDNTLQYYRNSEYDHKTGQAIVMDLIKRPKRK